MANELVCSGCSRTLVSARMVYVGKLQYAYHAWCYVMKMAPSARAGVMVN